MQCGWKPMLSKSQRRQYRSWHPPVIRINTAGKDDFMRRKNSGGAYRREKMILTASSVLVLTAMTVTGVYIYNSRQNEAPGDNVVDFSPLEDSAQNDEPEAARVENPSAQNLTSGEGDSGELDYDPYYAQADQELNEQQANGGGERVDGVLEGLAADDVMEGQASDGGLDGVMDKNVGYSEIGGDGTVNLQAAAGEGLTADASAAGEGLTADASVAGEGLTADTYADGEGLTTDGEQSLADASGAEEGQALAAVADVVQEEVNLHFSDEAKLNWPIVGNVLLNYSMDKTIYFPTLQQYKYNPSIVISSTQGTGVTCAADGVVKAIYDDPQTGNTVIMNLGDGYELTYGQLEDIAVEQGELVEAGVLIGRVAAPSKYYTVEGTNVYFKLTKDGEPVNPLDYLG